jgi:hypothetical protein
LGCIPTARYTASSLIGLHSTSYQGVTTVAFSAELTASECEVFGCTSLHTRIDGILWISRLLELHNSAKGVIHPAVSICPIPRKTRGDGFDLASSWVPTTSWLRKAGTSIVINVEPVWATTELLGVSFA